MIRKRTIELLVLLLICTSCEKWFTHKEEKFVECTSNCYNLVLTGEAINMVTGQGLKDIPVTLTWGKACVFCSDRVIGIRQSSDLGAFTFTNFIDSTNFANGGHLYLSVPANKDYIIFPWGNYFIFDSLNDSRLQTPKFEFYPKTQLQIKIERVESDTFESFGVEHRFSGGQVSYIDCTIARSNTAPPKEETFNAETAAGIKTYITWRKRYLTHDVDRIDSVLCKKDEVTIYKIYY